MDGAEQTLSVGPLRVSCEEEECRPNSVSRRRALAYNPPLLSLSSQGHKRKERTSLFLSDHQTAFAREGNQAFLNY